MTVRKRRRKNKLRGQRTHGSGNTKNRRGGGSRGGRGRGGSHKHKFQLYAKQFGTERPVMISKKETKIINLDLLMQKIPALMEKKLVEKTPQGIVIDGQKTGFGKILGKANTVKEKLIIRNAKVSKRAAEKILKAGGKIETQEENTEDEFENSETEEEEEESAE